MTKDEIPFFISGLRAVIKNAWNSQEEFAEGVTSKVHLSNILRHRVGASPKMRNQLAERAGLSVDDLIEMGKAVAKATAGTQQQVQYIAEAPQAAFAAEELDEMSPGELIGKLSDYSSDVTEKLLGQVKAVTSTMKILAEERSRVMGMLQREQLITNSIDETIKVVDTALNIVYCNRAYTEKYRQTAGDTCSFDRCSSCQGSCLAKSVFSTGKPEKRLVEYEGKFFYRTAYPMLSATGTISHAVVVSREIENMEAMLKNIGLKLESVDA